MKLRLSAFVLLACLLTGCDRIQSLSQQTRGEDSKGTAAQKVTTPAPDDAQASGDSEHNALFESEDSASRERRNKARASLGLGGK